MCGRFSLTHSIETVGCTFRASGDINYPKRYNIAPSQRVPIVGSSDGKHRKMALMQWGLIPSWARDASIGNRLINARAETIEEKPSFRMAYQSRRCIVPASGFYEWKRYGSRKQPYYIQSASKGLLALAGLWESWNGPDGVVYSFTIITTKPNELMKTIHDRMPVIIAPDYFEQWLNCRDYSGKDVSHLLRPVAADTLEAFPVSSLVNSPSNDSWKCAQPLDLNSH